MDKEKVIADLEFSYSTTLSGYAFANCGADIHGITGGILRDTLALLKAQEPVSVRKKHMEMVGLQTWNWACGNCGQTVLFSAKFCPWCGRAVKWNE